MPSRNVRARPLYWRIAQDRRINGLKDPWAMLAYTWLIPSADNLGRLEGDAGIVAGMLFSRQREMTPERVSTILQALHDSGLLFRYTARGEQYLQFPRDSWDKHQRLVGNMRAESDFPPPNPKEYAEWFNSTRVDTSINTFTPVPAEGKGKGKEEIPPPVGGEVGEGTASAENCDEQGAQADAPGNSKYTPEFESFWTAYPRKAAKTAAFKAWSTLFKQERKNGLTSASLIAAAGHYVVYCQQQGRTPDKMLHAATFLGPQRRFEDFVDGVLDEGNPATPPSRAAPTRVAPRNEIAERLEAEHLAKAAAAKPGG